MSKYAAIICTRNRPEALRNTLQSIAAQELSPSPTVIVVDGSSADPRRTNRETAAQASCPVHHHEYDGPPSAARQRNVGLDLLPESTDVVFFFDDDITLQDHCLQHLADALASSPDLGGVGAREVAGDPPSPAPAPSKAPLWKYLFLLDHPRPGRVLPSGRISAYTSPHTTNDQEATPTQWLSTCCCAYQRSVLRTIRFDDALWGALLEDLDLSYRISESLALRTVPEATFVHHRSPTNRRSAHQYAYDRLIQRYWFVKKNIDHPLRTWAFWWGTLGQLLALLASPKAAKWDALRGRLEGIRDVITRRHSLLGP